jgi:hypothetical protein
MASGRSGGVRTRSYTTTVSYNEKPRIVIPDDVRVTSNEQR